MVCVDGEVSGSFSGCKVALPCPDPVIQRGYNANCGATSCVPTSCALGYIGTPSGALECFNGVMRGSFSGCTQAISCSAPATPGYNSDCGVMGSGTTCNATMCATGYTGSPGGVLTCTNGVVSGGFNGCVPSSCHIDGITGGYTTTCGNMMASGTSCTASACASGYVGVPSGTLTCRKGVLSGILIGCVAAKRGTCTTPPSLNYTTDCGTTMAAGVKCNASACASGYVGVPSGTLTCRKGVVSGSLSGCTYPMPCIPNIALQYTTNCESTMMSGTTCSATACSPGFGGKAHGTLSCSNGEITGAFAGCKIKEIVKPARKQLLKL